MTMKKIGLSALVAATLTTGAFAAATIDGNGYKNADTTTKTFNINYSKRVSIDLNTSDEKGVTFTGFGVDAGQWIVFDLAGANFETNTSVVEYKILNSDEEELSTPASTIQEANKLQFKLAVDVNASDVVTLGFEYKESGSDTNETMLILPQNSTSNVTISAKALNDTGDVLLNSETSEFTIIEAKTTDAVTGTLVCGESSQSTILINSTTKSLLVPHSENPDSGAYDSDTVNCTLTIPSIQQQDFDFEYNRSTTDVVYSAGDFADGNFTSSVATKTSTATTETFTYTNLLASNSSDTTDTIDFETSGEDLLDTVFQANTKITYGSEDINETLDLVPTYNAMTLKLSTYEGTVTGVAYLDGVFQTNIRIFNNTDAPVNASVNVITKTGVDLGTKEYTAEPIGANSNIVLSANEIQSLFGTTENGFKVIVSIPVPSKKGDMEVLDTRGTQMSYKRVIDNNDDNQGN